MVDMSARGESKSRIEPWPGLSLWWRAGGCGHQALKKAECGPGSSIGTISKIGDSSHEESFSINNISNKFFDLVDLFRFPGKFLPDVLNFGNDEVLGSFLESDHSGNFVLYLERIEVELLAERQGAACVGSHLTTTITTIVLLLLPLLAHCQGREQGQEQVKLHG